MRIILRNFQARPIIDAEELRQLVGTALTATGGGGTCGVAFVFVDDAGMEDLHARFLGEVKTTDVLAFPANGDTADDPSYLGDVVVCADAAARQARDLGHGYLSELKILALHGLLHLLGYDHLRDRGEMRRLEEKLRPVVLKAGRTG